jgi:hypothetical protein
LDKRTHVILVKDKRAHDILVLDKRTHDIAGRADRLTAFFCPPKVLYRNNRKVRYVQAASRWTRCDTGRITQEPARVL